MKPLTIGELYEELYKVKEETRGGPVERIIMKRRMYEELRDDAQTLFDLRDFSEPRHPAIFGIPISIARYTRNEVEIVTPEMRRCRFMGKWGNTIGGIIAYPVLPVMHDNAGVRDMELRKRFLKRERLKRVTNIRIEDGTWYVTGEIEGQRYVIGYMEWNHDSRRLTLRTMKERFLGRETEGIVDIRVREEGHSEPGIWGDPDRLGIPA